MSSAKVILKVQDRSTIVPSLPGLYGAVVVRSKKGEINKPYLVTSENEYIDVFGEPDPKYPETYAPLVFLQESNKVWVVRASHEDIKYAGAIVRSKVTGAPTDALGVFTNDMRIVDPLINGLTEDELKSYTFNLYPTNRLYSQETIKILENVKNENKIKVNNFGDLKVNDKISITDLTLEKLNDATTLVGENQPLFTINELKVENNEYDLIKLADAINVTKGQEVLVKDDDGNYVSYSQKVYVAISSENTNQVIVYNADYMQPGDNIKIGNQETTFNEKEKITLEENFLIIDNNITIDTNKTIYKLIQFELEERDSFLVVEKTPGLWGNKKIAIGITPSKDYEEAFKVLVYFDGVLVEDFEVTKTDFIDGFGNQLYLEDVINNKSKYIKVVDNRNNPNKPLNTNYSYWRKLEEDIFRDTSVTLKENVLKGHVQVSVSDTSKFTIGDRIKFAYDVDTKGNVVLSKEYKIQSIDSKNNYIFLDRQLEEEEINITYTDLDGNTQNTTIHKFSETYNDVANGIVNGVKHYPVTKLNKVFYNYYINKIIKIGDDLGRLLDAGVNLIAGGSNGSVITIGDMINALYTLKNSEETPVTLLMSGGIYEPAYIQAMKEVVEAQQFCHGYIASDPNAEDSPNWKTELVNHLASLNIDTENMSYCSGWGKIYDRYNQKEVWVGPDVFFASQQSYTYRNYYMWYPASGWLRGRITILDSKIKPNEGDRDYLVDNKINPMKYVKGSGYILWGNRTMYSKPSPLNDRSVVMLLIVIKYGLKNMLEYKTFELNTEETWNEVENAISNFLEDIKQKNGLYEYQVAVKSIITPQDIDNNRMPVFVGIKPTRAIKEIPVTLAIFNYGAKIEVKV